MDDSDVERIVYSVEKKFGKTRTEFAGRNKTYRQILLERYLYIDRFHKTREELEQEGRRTTISGKQDLKLKIGFKSYARYGRVDQYTMRAIRTLIKRGRKV
jgi:hypothetical protein